MEPWRGELGRRKSPLLHRRPPCLKLLLQGLGVRIPKSVILFERAVLGERPKSVLNWDTLLCKLGYVGF